jgi:hypothetical protein
VSAVPKDAVPRHDGAVQATSGEFAGWWTWTRDNFEVNNGRFWHREEESGEIRCAFRLEKKHTNGSGAVHGVRNGLMLSTADVRCPSHCYRTADTPEFLKRANRRQFARVSASKCQVGQCPLTAMAEAE